MKIDVSTQKKLNNFYKLIPIYKMFKLTKFESTDPNIKLVIEALNIKNRKKRITFIYDKSCELIDKTNKNINVCGFKNNQCIIQRCKKSPYKCGCCRRCRYQSINGCPTKNLTCKLFNCSKVKQKYKTLSYEDINLLKLLSIKNRIIIKSDYFSSREDVLKDLYKYTLTYSTIRIIYRLIRDYYYVNKMLSN